MKIFKYFGLLTTLGAICAGTIAVFAADSAKPAEKLKPYTLTTCIVTGEKLGEMGAPVVTNYLGQEIKFCCKSCIKDFDKSPAKFIKAMTEAEAKAAKK